MSSATIPNSDIVFRRDGAGDRALVFVHGFLDDQYVWNPVIADLTAPGFEIVRLDLAGFGDRTEATGRSRAGTVPGLPSADGAIGT